MTIEVTKNWKTFGLALAWLHDTRSLGVVLGPFMLEIYFAGR